MRAVGSHISEPGRLGLDRFGLSLRLYWSAATTAAAAAAATATADSAAATADSGSRSRCRRGGDCVGRGRLGGFA